MTPDAAIAMACRSAIAVSSGSVLTVERPCSRRYCEIISAMSSACANVAVMASATARQSVFIASPHLPAQGSKSIRTRYGGYKACRGDQHCGVVAPPGRGRAGPAYGRITASKMDHSDLQISANQGAARRSRVAEEANVPGPSITRAEVA